MEWAFVIAVVGVAVLAIALAGRLSRSKLQELTDDWPPETRAQFRRMEARQAELEAQYPRLFEDLRQCLFKHDPMGINLETNTDEYDPEVATIIPRLPSCTSREDVLNVVHDELVRWFGEDIVKPKDRYAELSAEIWKTWNEPS